MGSRKIIYDEWKAGKNLPKLAKVFNITLGEVSRKIIYDEWKAGESLPKLAKVFNILGEVKTIFLSTCSIKKH